MRSVVLVAVLATLLPLVPTGSAQTHHCPTDDSLLLVFRNPDLQPGADGFIHAQGQFFVQFQAIGATADQIKVFGFSFGPFTHDFDEGACGNPQPAPWVTGTYVPNYRADREPADGFFIPIKTPLVPDGTYAAAVHAYDANNNELARFWAKAVVDNCDTAPTPAQERCDGAENQAQRVAHDKTAPWPIILPGDGQPLAGHKFTVEFGEELQSHKVYLNGVDITTEMVEWPGRQWDADYSPDYGPAGIGGAISPPCSGAPGQTCETYGKAFEWLGRDLGPLDVVRVEATDLAGNKAVKDIHIGSSVAGGAITEAVPILSDTVDAVRKSAVAGAAVTFNFNITNQGAGTGHPFASATGPAGWILEWQPVHVAVPPGKTMPQKLVVTVPAGAAEGVYSVAANLTYTANAKQNVLPHALQVQVGGSEVIVPSNSTATSDGPVKESPMPLALVAVGIAALVGRLSRKRW